MKPQNWYLSRFVYACLGIFHCARRLRLLSAHSLRVAFVRVCLAYAISLCLAETIYQASFSAHDIQTAEALEYAAGVLFPYDRRYRIAYALQITNDVLTLNEGRARVEQAISALKQALSVDTTDASLLPYLVSLDLQENHIDDARKAFAQFKRVAKLSPLAIKFAGAVP